ncbi:hypothetical protein [Parafrankia discariae]|uniref:hypothetical protein n=1 Tax=Parafrankia discariae TaxID=365528 RepID=UPI0006888519|nr:hypothetical protein [Parafrankia discariae]
MDATGWGELVDSVDIRIMLGWGRGGEPVNRSSAAKVINDYRFPRAAISHPPDEPDRPRLRLWRLADVERWMDVNRPGWRTRRPVVEPPVLEDAPTTRAQLRAA